MCVVHARAHNAINSFRINLMQHNIEIIISAINPNPSKSIKMSLMSYCHQAKSI